MPFLESLKDFCAFCGKDIMDKVHWLEREGKKLFFCSHGCLQNYEKKKS